MAKWQFADKARQILQDNGVSVNEDGTTSRVVAPAQTVIAGENNIVPTVDEQGTTPSDNSNDTLLEMQRRELEQLRAEKANWQSHHSQPQRSQREQELENELADLRSKLAQQTEAEQADEMREILEAQGFDSENLDDDVLLEVRDRLLKPMANKVYSLEKQIADIVAKQSGPTAEELLVERRSRGIMEVKKALPDFDTVYNSEAFQQKLASKDPRFPTGTYGEILQVAYDNGDHEFLIREINSFLGKGSEPNLAAVADVGAVNGVGNTATLSQQGSGFTFSDEEARQMLDKFRLRQISRQEYSAYRAKLDEYRSGKT